MRIEIQERGQDVLLITTSSSNRRTTLLATPTWSDLIDALQDAARDAIRDVAGADASAGADGRAIGAYQYDSWLNEHVLTFFPRRAAPAGWLATHLGTAFAHYVEVREDGGGSVTMWRPDLDRWTSTDLPRPGACFDEMQTLSRLDDPNVEWADDDPPSGEIVAVVDPEPDEADDLMVALYPDSWGRAMWTFVCG